MQIWQFHKFDEVVFNGNIFFENLGAEVLPDDL